MFKTDAEIPPKWKTCPVNKLMKKINEDHKDKSRLKLDEKYIFQKPSKQEKSIKKPIKNGKKNNKDFKK